MKECFKNIKLTTKFSFLLLAVIVILFFAEILNREKGYREYNQMLHENSAQILNVYTNYIENVIDRIEGVVDSILNDTFLQENLQELSVVQKESEYWDLLSETNARIRSYYYRDAYFSSLSLALDNYLLTHGEIGLIHINEKDVLEEYIALCQNTDTPKMLTRNGQIIILQEYRGVHNGIIKNYGYIIAHVSLKTVIDDLKREVVKDGQKVHLSIFDGEDCLYGKQENLSHFKDKEDGWYIREDNFISVHTFRDLGYTMIISIDYSEVQEKIGNVQVTSLWISIAVGVLAFYCSYLLIKLLIRDIGRLVCLMDEFGQGKKWEGSELQQYQGRRDETGRLYRHFYQMIRDYNKITEEHYENKLMMKEMEFTYLQKQIHPHFLYNTLSAISWSAYANEDEETAHMIENLGKMMRAITENSETMVSVEQDLQIANCYIMIQKMRFGENLHVDVDVSDSARKLMLPKLSIQPIVENSVNYVLGEMIGACRIRIFDRKNGADTEIVIEDNGAGFEENILDKLQNGEIKPRGNGSALRNIHIRLQYVFSEKYGLRFRRSEQGMQVILLIPGEFGQIDKNV